MIGKYTMSIGVSMGLFAFVSFIGNMLANDGPKDPPTAASAYEFKVNDIDGKETSLGAYQGKVLLVVNVASKCGYTPQYEALEKLYKDYEAKGLVVVGFPANEFGGQEPGSNAEIKSFCSLKYSVTFPMMSKVVVKGEGQAPLFAYLTAAPHDDTVEGNIKWNFEKFLIGKDGKLLHRYRSGTTPLDKKLLADIDAALAAKADAPKAEAPAAK